MVHQKHESVSSSRPSTWTFRCPLRIDRPATAPAGWFAFATRRINHQSPGRNQTTRKHDLQVSPMYARITSAALRDDGVPVGAQSSHPGWIPHEPAGMCCSTGSTFHCSGQSG